MGNRTAPLILLVLLQSCTHTNPPPDTGPDTTSHSFTWTVDTLGDGNSSILYDVAIINDTLAYAVGEMYLRDSAGQFDLTLYNQAVWNGIRWQIQRINWQGYPSPIRFIFVNNRDDIWFGMGYLIHWDGLALREIQNSAFLGIRTNRMWGSAANGLYVACSNGTIVYSNDYGTTWQKLTTGTTLPIQDIWGGVNGKTGQTEIYAVASTKFEIPSGKMLLQLNGSTVSAVIDSGLPFSLSGLWFLPGSRYYVVGDGLFEKTQIATNDSWTSFHTGLTTFYTEAVRGSARNDVFVVGHFGTILHFNGSTWHNYQNEISIPGALLHAVSIRGNTVIAVGEDGTRGIVLIGRR